MSKTSTPTTTSYPKLVKNIQSELSELDFFVKRRTAESYWKVGRFIHEHLLEHKDRADYGHRLIERLAEDVDREASTLQKMLRFYRAYPILAPGPKLTWSHYRTLMSVEDKNQRKELERQISQKNWDTHKLQEYLNTKRGLEDPQGNHKPVPQLKFTRGRLNTYKIVKPKGLPAKKVPLVLDMGFRMSRFLPKGKSFSEGDIVRLARKKDSVSVEKVKVPETELFTYKAGVDKVIDADTLLVTFDFGLESFISQKLRLRGIDCPEMDTDAGQRAKRFVEARFLGLPFTIVKTTKDRSDKFDRYLADVFYMKGETDPQKVASQGTYLNQELLNERLAVEYE